MQSLHNFSKVPVATELKKIGSHLSVNSFEINVDCAFNGEMGILMTSSILSPSRTIETHYGSFNRFAEFFCDDYSSS